MSDQPLTIPDHAAQVLVVRRRYWPVATLVILALNVAVFLLMTFAGGSMNPDVLLNFGASYGPYFRRGEYWRIVMPMFLHIGWLHLLVNSYALYILGPILEKVYGYGRFSLLYVLMGMGSSFLSMKLSQNVAAGASGAIFGIAGAMLVAGYLHRDIIPPRWGRAFGRGIVPFIVVNLAFGFSVRGIDNWGHLGGLASGIVLAALIPPPGHSSVFGSIAEEGFQALVIVPLAVVALALAATANHYRTFRVVTRLLAEGARFRAQKQNDRARERFQEAVRRVPNDERPHEELGALYLQDKRFAESLQEFKEALRLSPDSSRARLGLALAYRQSGDLAKAREVFEALLGRNPGNAEGQLTLADLYAEQKLYAEAIDHYQAALRLSPNMAVAHNNLAWLYATSEDSQYRNPKEALEHARRAVALSQWKQAAFIDTLAEALYVNGNYDEAVKVQTLALKLEPDNPEYVEHMARYRKAAGV